MPFKINGAYYFEAPRFWKGKDKEMIYNKLALCPICAAKWQHAKQDTPEELRQKLLSSTDRKISVTLAGKTETLYFWGKHFGDLQTLLREAETA